MKKNILRNESGMAIMMVMSVIAIMAFLLADFTFESKVNKLKVYNQQDKLQARLNAEAGLNFALAKLKLYQEGRNLIEKNKQLKELIQPSVIESVVTMEFIYPIPIPAKSDIQQRSALEEFEKNNLIKGRMGVTINSVSGFLNPNILRITKTNNQDEERRNFDEDEEDEKDVKPDVFIEKKLVETLTQALEDEKENNPDFDLIYGNVNPELLVKELKFYVNDLKNFNDMERAEIEANYLAANITPKHAPLTSIDELYLLLGWNDKLIELIKDKLTVHEVSIIAVNELTSDQLKILFPDITDFQLEQFFKHRDGDQELQIEPQEFKSEKDFKEVVVNKLAIVDSSNYEKRKKELEQAGLKIAVAGKLYKVVSKGFYGRAEYSITAFVDLPIKPVPEKKKEEEKKEAPPVKKEGDVEDEEFIDPPLDEKEDEEKKEEVPMELLSPRVIEIRLQ
ncbi:hypothetical protein BIY24_05995 [Halobacteriovorax marinus]|uniref:Exported protein n=1 Tax=Halobacteriovorax marinus (strain ATCC BAA-682 / DSM 15412 / SJ) TaxID=862908 RepID=E1WZ40_HALMS|nr:hypothetical protein [Halobacteriovorax marinus]ATH07509.1 hypothetical protein BIY24_05995 [Halobacteriovorax marinus]CBW26137.1 putative exported protein [Halobacteriovorax marinus SJ]